MIRSTQQANKTKAQRAVLGEVPVLELELLHLKTTLDDLHGLRAADRHVSGDLLVTADTERTEGVPCLGQDGFLVADLVEHTGSLRQPVAGPTARDVQDELVDAHGAHDVALSLRFLRDRGHLDRSGGAVDTEWLNF